LAADDAFLLHLEVSVEGGLIHGQVRGSGIDPILFDIGLIGANVGLRSGELRTLGVDLRCNFLLVELSQLLPLWT